MRVNSLETQLGLFTHKYPNMKTIEKKVSFLTTKHLKELKKLNAIFNKNIIKINIKNKMAYFQTIEKNENYTYAKYAVIDIIDPNDTNLINPDTLEKAKLDQKIAFEHFTYFLIDYEKGNIAYIRGKSTNNLNQAFYELAQNNNIYLSIVPISDENMIEQIINRGTYKSITFYTANQSIASELPSIFRCSKIANNINKGEYNINKIKCTISFKQVSAKEKELVTYLRNNKDEFSRLNLDDIKGAIDLINDEFNLKTKILIPKKDDDEEKTTALKFIRDSLANALYYNTTSYNCKSINELLYGFNNP